MPHSFIPIRLSTYADAGRENRILGTMKKYTILVPP